MDSLFGWQIERFNHPKMEFYRHAYSGSRRILSGLPDLSDQHVIVYFEQGLGDTIQLLRYLNELRAAKVTVACARPLHALIENQWNVTTLNKLDPNLPEHDWHILSMDLPYLFPKIRNEPYVTTGVYNEVCDLPSPRLGIAFEGNPQNPSNLNRSCPLTCFREAYRASGSVFCLQPEIHLPELIEGAEDMTLLSEELNSFYDTARLISSLDYVISVDTAVAHLAGAIGKPTYLMLAYEHDDRWGSAETTAWYPSMKVIRQPSQGDWEGAFEGLRTKLNPPSDCTYQS